MKEETKTQFDCTECDAGFTTRSALAGHRWRVHKQRGAILHGNQITKAPTPLVAPKQFICTQCNKGPFKTAGALGSHLLRMHGVLGKARQQGKKDHVCPLCQKGFRNDLGLRFHTAKMHRGQAVPQTASTDSTIVIQVVGVNHCPECGHNLSAYHGIKHQEIQREKAEVIANLVKDGYQIIPPK